MILFLDTVSPLPEFSLIEDNKIIYSKEILNKDQDKMSDHIIPIYLNLEKEFSLFGRLKYLILNTGPGSYTALRVGIAFLSGLSLARNISLIGISCVDLFRYLIKKEELISSAIFITSSNNQNFFCFYDIKQNKHIINKIENKDESMYKKQLSLKKIFTNTELPLQKFNFSKNLKSIKINFNTLVNQNILDIISLPKKEVIEPIYISNNKILK